MSKKPTVAEVQEWLKKFPKDARVYAYEGETVCIVVTKGDKQLGFLEAFE